MEDETDRVIHDSVLRAVGQFSELVYHVGLGFAGSLGPARACSTAQKALKARHEPRHGTAAAAGPAGRIVPQA